MECLFYGPARTKRLTLVSLGVKLNQMVHGFMLGFGPIAGRYVVGPLVSKLNPPATLLVLLLALSGCGRKQPAATPAAADQQTQPATAENAPPQPLEGQVDPFMTGQLRIFIQQNGRMPNDFGELAKARLDSVPRTPLGMKWAIDPATQEVKMVKQ